MKKNFFGIFFVCVFSFLLLFSADRALGLAGYPTEPAPPVAHAPDWTEERRNLEFSYSIRTNSRGIRYREIPLRKDTGESRVAVIGDSFTEGVGVESEQTFPAILERSFPGVSFINCGVVGAGPDQYARLLRSVALAYDPDLVLLVLYANDVIDTPTVDEKDLASGEGWLLPRQRIRKSAERGSLRSALYGMFPRLYTMAVSAKDRWRPRPKHWDFVNEAAREAREKGVPEADIRRWEQALPPDLVEAASRGEFDAYMLVHGLLHRTIWLESLDLAGDGAAKWRTAQAMLDRMLDLGREHGTRLAVVYAPAPFQYDGTYRSPSLQVGVQFRPEWLQITSTFEERLSEWASGKGIPFLNLTPAFREAARVEPSQLNFKRDPHWTSRGNEVAAAAISAWFREKGLLAGSG